MEALIKPLNPAPALAPSPAPKSSRTLFAIGEDIMALYDLLTEMGGDVTDAETEAAVDAWLAEIGADRDQKLDAYCALIREFESVAAARAAEAERLQELAAHANNEATRLRNRLHQFMLMTGDTKIETLRNRLAVQKNGGKIPVLVGDEAAIPKSFQKAEYLIKIQVDRALDAQEKKVQDFVDKALELPGATYKMFAAADKDKIRTALENGVEVTGAALGQRGTRLVIK